MIDDPELALLLKMMLDEAVPFEVWLTPVVAARLKFPGGGQRHIVTKVVYLGDEGGMMCYIGDTEAEELNIISLTHLRIPATTPWVREINAYQRHRIKKLKKLGEFRAGHLTRAERPAE